jgi:hypothetical protein
MHLESGNNPRPLLPLPLQTNALSRSDRPGHSTRSEWATNKLGSRDSVGGSLRDARTSLALSVRALAVGRPAGSFEIASFRLVKSLACEVQISPPVRVEPGVRLKPSL